MPGGQVTRRRWVLAIMLWVGEVGGSIMAIVGVGEQVYIGDSGL